MLLDDTTLIPRAIDAIIHWVHPRSTRAALRELEPRVLFEELLARYPDIRVDGPVTRIRTNFLNSIKTMPVRYTPRSRAA
ncbi:MAG: hypothetical protein KF911_02850 [Pseudomonadales bacterium]|nr:hypothetical protein [Pseudomonadales bacterium]